MGKSLQDASLNQGWIYTEQIPLSAAGQTVLDYYTQRYRHSSRNDWQHRIEAQQIYLDGHPISSTTRLQSGQTLTYHRPPWYEPDVPLQIEVLYEDEALWAIAKPSGLPVLPGGGFLTHTLLHQLQKQYPHETPIPIHRLGRGTSGVMLVARSPQTRSHLSHQFRTHTMTKIYRTLITSVETDTGTFPNGFTLQYPIGKVHHPTLGYLYNATPSGKSAHSECHIIERNLPFPGIRPIAPNTSSLNSSPYSCSQSSPTPEQPNSQPLALQKSTLLKVKILTGRPHQIRIHLAAYGYPLLGDPLYGVGAIIPGAVPSDCGYWLHAHHLGFIHPMTGKPMMIECPPPAPLDVGYE